MAVGNGGNGGNCRYKMIKDGMGNLTCTVFFYLFNFIRHGHDSIRQAHRCHFCNGVNAFMIKIFYIVI